MEDRLYVVVANRPWHGRIFERMIRGKPGKWLFVTTVAEVLGAILFFNPRYVFFLHWSEKVPEEVWGKVESVCFHMTAVPFGRGGSPLQNLIARGFRETEITALRMTGEMDAGPVYCQEPLSLEGLAEEIYIRASEASLRMAFRIAQEEPTPYPQTGEVTVFKRRKSEQSLTPGGLSLDGLFDHIRMLDAEGYPRAFLTYGGMRYEFSRPALRDGRIVADVEITEAKDA